MLARTEATRAVDPWDRLAARYRWQEPLERRSLDALVEAVALRPHEVHLDLGTGTGGVLRRLAAAGRPVTAPSVAVDRSRAMLALRPAPPGRLLRVDAARLPLADGSVDVVTAAWVLHVLDPAARAAAVSEVARVLRPGGRLGLVVPAAPRTAVQRVVRAAAQRAAGDIGAYHVPEDLPALLDSSGLRARHAGRTRAGYLADVVVAVRAGRAVARGARR